MVTDIGMTLAAFQEVSLFILAEVSDAQGHTMIDAHVMADQSRFADHDARAMIDTKRFADLSARMNVDAGLFVGVFTD